MPSHRLVRLIGVNENVLQQGSHGFDSKCSTKCAGLFTNRHKRGDHFLLSAARIVVPANKHAHAADQLDVSLQLICDIDAIQPGIAPEDCTTDTETSGEFTALISGASAEVTSIRSLCPTFLSLEVLRVSFVVLSLLTNEDQVEQCEHRR